MCVAHSHTSTHILQHAKLHITLQAFLHKETYKPFPNAK